MNGRKVIPLPRLARNEESVLFAAYRPGFGSSGNTVGSAPEFGIGGGRADKAGSGMIAGAKDGLAAGVGVAGVNATGISDAGSSSSRIVPNVPGVEELRCGLVRGGAAELLVAGAGSSASRIVPKLPSDGVVGCGLLCGATIGRIEAGSSAGRIVP